MVLTVSILVLNSLACVRTERKNSCRVVADCPLRSDELRSLVRVLAVAPFDDAIFDETPFDEALFDVDVLAVDAVVRVVEVVLAAVLVFAAAGG